MIRVVLPYHLRNLAKVGREVQLDIEGEITIADVLDTLEAEYPVLRGTVRDHMTKERRALLRFFMLQEDYSNEPYETPLPDEIVSGKEPFRVVGAMAGG
ncbi:MAG: MoaD/ThiS family protein [Anaerolineales bacterium]|nr:MoaD/ThiS family protein [Anaerolineales bacterium]